MTLPSAIGRALAAFALFSWTAPALADAPLCRLPRLARAEFVQQANGSLLLPVTINGIQEYFALSGYTESVIYASDADRLKLGSHHYQRDDEKFLDGHRIKARRTAELTIGRVRWPNFEFFSREEPKPPGTKFAGWLGLDFFESKQLDIDLNLGANEINFIQAGGCTSPPWIVDLDAIVLDDATGIVLPVSLDGHALFGIFDWDSEFSSIDLRTAAGDFALDPASPDVQPLLMRDDKGRPIYSHTFAMLDLGWASLSRLSVHLADFRRDEEAEVFRNRFQALYPFGLTSAVSQGLQVGVLRLGRNEIKRLRFFIMFPEHKLFVTPVSPLDVMDPSRHMQLPNHTAQQRR